MTSINISVPDQMKDFIDEQIGEGGYRDPSDYFQALLIEQQRRKAEEKLEDLLRQGLSSEMSALDEKEWEDIRNELGRRIAENK